MKIVLDTNILIAALLRDSQVRKLISLKNHEFCTPSYVLQEIKEHEEELLTKAHLSKEEFKAILNSITQNISLVSDDQIAESFEKAKQIMDSIDKDDTPIIATALAIQAEGILSFDGHFKEQSTIKIFQIAELLSNH